MVPGSNPCHGTKRQLTCFIDNVPKNMNGYGFVARRPDHSNLWTGHKYSVHTLNRAGSSGLYDFLIFCLIASSVNWGFVYYQRVENEKMISTYISIG